MRTPFARFRKVEKGGDVALAFQIIEQAANALQILGLPLGAQQVGPPPHDQPFGVVGPALPQRKTAFDKRMCKLVDLLPPLRDLLGHATV